LAGRTLVRVGGYPRGVAQLARFIGVAVLGGMLLAGLGFVLPGPDWLRWTVAGIGVVIGISGWLAWPFWYLSAGRYLSAPESVSRVTI
jgi:hypothetical protein